MQKTINDINAEWSVKHGEAWDEADKAGLAFFISKGGQVVSLSDEESKKWEAAVAPVFAEYIKKANKKGVDGKAVVDFIKSKM